MDAVPPGEPRHGIFPMLFMRRARFEVTPMESVPLRRLAGMETKGRFR